MELINPFHPEINLALDGFAWLVNVKNLLQQTEAELWLWSSFDFNFKHSFLTDKLYLGQTFIHWSTFCRSS